MTWSSTIGSAVFPGNNVVVKDQDSPPLHDLRPGPSHLTGKIILTDYSTNP